MKAKFALFAVVLLLLLPQSRSAPITEAQLHAHPDVPVVNGYEHPELIPEGTAYRLYFLNLTQVPGAGRSITEVHHDNLKPLGLSEPEISAASLALEDFRQKYDQLAAEYNASDQSTAQWNLFVDKRNALLDTTRQRLKIFLRVSSVQSLHQHVLSERSRMATQEGTDQSLSASVESAPRGPRIMPVSFGRQTQCSLHPGYSLYVHYSIQDSQDSNADALLTKSVTLEGTTTVTGSCYAYHKPWMAFWLDTHEWAGQTGEVPMTSYIDLPGSLSTLVTSGNQIGNTTEATIYCSVFKGNIFSYTARWTVAISKANYQYSSNDEVNCYYNLDCVPSTQQPTCSGSGPVFEVVQGMLYHNPVTGLPDPICDEVNNPAGFVPYYLLYQLAIFTPAKSCLSVGPAYPKDRPYPCQ